MERDCARGHRTRRAASVESREPGSSGPTVTIRAKPDAPCDADGARQGPPVDAIARIGPETEACKASNDRGLRSRHVARKPHNGAGGNRTPKHLRNLREFTPIPSSAQRQAQRWPHLGQNGAQSRPRRGRWPGAAMPRPTPTWPVSWRRGPTCPPTCVPGSSRRSARPRPPADPARRTTEPTKPAMPQCGGSPPPVPSAATAAWFLPARLADVTPAGTAAGID